ncbi:hypothetical protein, partial [Gemella morbillorum]
VLIIKIALKIDIRNIDKEIKIDGRVFLSILYNHLYSLYIALSITNINIVSINIFVVEISFSITIGQ